jgi:hypothetical protein
MAMKKDDDKSKRTLSGKKPATFGGANSKLIKPKPTALTSPGPRATPSRPMGKDATGERNWDKSSSSRVMVSAGPATMSMGGRTPKSSGGTNASNARATPIKKSSPMAKMSSGGTVAPSTVQGSQKALAEQKSSARTSRNIALGVGGAMLGAGITVAGGGKKIKQAVKYIADTKNRRARNKIQKAENEAVIVERNKGKATVKASKRTMEGLRRARKGQ